MTGWLWPALVSPLVGSFGGVLIRRLPRGRNVTTDRSRCEACGIPLAPRDLLPLLSFAALRGRCRHCRAPIDPFHWRVELAAVPIPLIAAAAGLADEAVWLASAVGWVLLVLAWIDAECLLLPDVLTLPLLVAGLGATGWLDPAALADHAVAAGLGWLSLWAVAWLYRWLRGRDGLGEGDAKLLGALGAWVGLGALASVLLGAALGGLAWAGLLSATGRPMTAGTALPFGPFLAASGWVTLLLVLR